jgi:phage shock protein PspC (stress-responsive transcriptional regulator)
MNKFKRTNQHSIFLGVLSGLAYFLEAPAWIVRIVFCLFCFFAGPGGCIFFTFLYLLIGFLHHNMNQIHKITKSFANNF